MKITTNNVPRPILDALELTPAERRWHDYLDWPAIERGEDSASFVRYRGHAYNLGEFERLPPFGTLSAAGWHGSSADSAFSAALIRLSDDGESAVLGWYYE